MLKLRLFGWMTLRGICVGLALSFGVLAFLAIHWHVPAHICGMLLGVTVVSGYLSYLCTVVIDRSVVARWRVLQ